MVNYEKVLKVACPEESFLLGDSRIKEIVKHSKWEEEGAIEGGEKAQVDVIFELLIASMSLASAVVDVYQAWKKESDELKQKSKEVEYYKRQLKKIRQREMERLDQERTEKIIREVINQLKDSHG